MCYIVLCFIMMYLLFCMLLLEINYYYYCKGKCMYRLTSPKPTTCTDPTAGLTGYGTAVGQLVGCMCRVPRKQDMEIQHNKSNLREFRISRTSHAHNRHIPTECRSTTYQSEEDTDTFYYNTIDNILEKQSDKTLVMGDFNWRANKSIL